METIEAISGRFKKIYRNKFFRYGIPFLLLVVGGSFGLKEFAQIRYQFSKKKLITHEEAEKMGIKMKKEGEVTLESEYNKIKSIDIDNWENKRGPRPWENSMRELRNRKKFPEDATHVVIPAILPMNYLIEFFALV